VGSVSYLRTYTAKYESDDVAQLYIHRFQENMKELYNKFKFSEEMIFTEDDKKLFDEATVCHIIM